MAESVLQRMERIDAKKKIADFMNTKYMKEIVLDINAGYPTQHVDAKQGDKHSRFLKIQLLSDGTVYEIGSAETVFMRVKRPDHKSVRVEATKESDGTIQVELTDLCLKVPGEATADIYVLDGDGGILSSANFILNIRKNPAGTFVVSEGDAENLWEEIAEIKRDIKDIRGDIADLQYEPIEITYFKVNPNVFEVGYGSAYVELIWGFSKDPEEILLNGDQIPVEASGYKLWTDPVNMLNNRWVLRVTDERGAIATAQCFVDYLDGVYYGAAPIPETLDSSFVLGLESKVLSGKKIKEFTVNAGENQYIWYCLPTFFGNCVFSVGGFTGGFQLVENIVFENMHGFQSGYRVYRSVQPNLGNTTVEVT